jgi:hypothetical protein
MREKISALLERGSLALRKEKRVGVKELQSTDEFRASIDKNKLAVVLFYDPRTLGKSLLPMLSGGAEQLRNVTFARVDVSTYPEIYGDSVSRGGPAARHPCLMCYRDGHVLSPLELSLTTDVAAITTFLQQVAASE